MLDLPVDTVAGRISLTVASVISTRPFFSTGKLRVLADVGNTRRRHLGGAGALASAGVSVTTIGLVLGFAVPVAVLPVPVALLAGLLVARSRRVERYRVALEQVLDRLEQGEIRTRQRLAPPRASALMRVASEIKRSVEDVAQGFREPPGGGAPPPPSSNPNPKSQ